jgi:hypothetical protein
MSTERPFPAGWVAGLLVLLSLGFAGWAFQQRRQAQAETARLAAAQLSLEASIKHTQAKIDAHKREAAAQAAAAARAQAAAAAKAGGQPDVDAILTNHPEVLAMFVKAIRGQTDQVYGALFARLHLSADQIDHLKTLIVNDLEAQLDLRSTAQSQGLRNDDPAIVKERDQQKADLQAAEQALLGPEAYAAYNAATRTEPLRGAVGQIAYMTQFSAAPLTGSQSEQLLELMAQSSSDYRGGKEASTKTVDWDAVMAQASGFLAPSQLATLQGVAQENRFEALAREFDAQQAAAK